MKVSLCVPCYRASESAFLASIVQLAIIAQRDIPGIEIWPIVKGSVPLISRVRNEIAQEAMNWGADWLLWLDNDHGFPPQTLQRLLAHGKPIVGANYLRRHGERLPTAVGPTGLVSSDHRTGIEEVTGLGLGICLVSSKVFAAIPKPWFALTDEHPSEDYGFFAAARKAGFPVHVDHDLSRECGHVAERILTFN